jgi:hypothetical protein
MAANLMNINSLLLDDKDYMPTMNMNVKVTTSHKKPQPIKNSGAFYDRGRSPPAHFNNVNNHIMHPNDAGLASHFH